MINAESEPILIFSWNFHSSATCRWLRTTQLCNTQPLGLSGVDRAKVHFMADTVSVAYQILGVLLLTSITMKCEKLSPIE